MKLLGYLILGIFVFNKQTLGGILYPRASESREVLPLDGLWKFRIADTSDQQRGFLERWFAKSFTEVINLNA